MKSIDLESITRFLQETPLPSVGRNKLTFFDITKYPHLENVWSNIYAFFINPNTGHGLNELFLNSIIEIIKQKTGNDFNFTSDIEVETQFHTIKGGFIDIIVSDEQTAFIIENKVYHHLNNDLKDYWNSIKKPRKQGIILSLAEIRKINDNNFINITHIELLQHIAGNLVTYFLNAEEKYLILLKDFYQNIKNMTNPMEPKLIEFYLNNEQTIQEIQKIQNSYSDFIKSETVKAAEMINEPLDPNNKTRLCYYLCPENPNLMFTVFYDKFFTSTKALEIVVEMQGELLKKRDRIKKIQFTDEEERLIIKKFYKNTSTGWAHFAEGNFKLSNKAVLNLSAFISETINKSPLLSIYRKLKNIL